MFVGKLLSGKFTGPKDPGQGSPHWTVRKGEEKERKSVHTQGCREQGGRPKCLDYIGRSLCGKGSPAPGLESSRLRAGMPGRD